MIINKIKRLVWVAMLCLVSIAAQAQYNTHQSINDVLRQTAGKEMSLLYQIPEEETVPAIFISGNVAYRLKTIVHKVNESKQDIFAENLDNILVPLFTPTKTWLMATLPWWVSTTER